MWFIPDRDKKSTTFWELVPCIEFVLLLSFSFFAAHSNALSSTLLPSSLFLLGTAIFCAFPFTQRVTQDREEKAGGKWWKRSRSLMVASVQARLASSGPKKAFRLHRTTKRKRNVYVVLVHWLVQPSPAPLPNCSLEAWEVWWCVQWSEWALPTCSLATRDSKIRLVLICLNFNEESYYDTSTCAFFRILT